MQNDENINAEENLPDDLMTIRDACSLLPGSGATGRISKRTLWRYVACGSLRSYRLGGQVFVRRADVLALPQLQSIEQPGSQLTMQRLVKDVPSVKDGPTGRSAIKPKSHQQASPSTLPAEQGKGSLPVNQSISGSLNDTENHEYLTAGEVAKLLRVSPECVQRWCQRGMIESKRVLFGKGGRRYQWLIPRAAALAKLSPGLGPAVDWQAIANGPRPSPVRQRYPGLEACSLIKYLPPTE